jgi:predicted ATP-grasp superfamily ATP-dependent carboligase
VIDGGAHTPTAAALPDRPATFDGIDARTPVLVLSAQNYGSLGIIRSLGRLGVPVYAVDADPRRPAASSRYLRGRFRYDVAGSSADATLDFLASVGRKIGSRTVLFPTWDETAQLANTAYDRLSEHFILPRQPDNLAWALASKKEMHRLAKEHSIPTPEVTFPADVEEVRAFAATAAYPVMLKGIDGNRLKRRTGRKMEIVHDAEELVRRYVEMEDPDEPNLMLQEYIPGGDDTIWMFNGYFDANSDCLASFTGRKLRQTPPYTGVTSLGICERNEVVEETTRSWMKALGYRGILDIGYRYDARDGKFKVLDANPRIGATFRLFVAKNGLDVARALYLDLTGQPVPIAEQVEGRKWLVEGGDFDSFLRYRRDGKLTTRRWLGTLAGVSEAAYFAKDDPRPFLGVCSEFIRRKAGGGAS